MAIVKSNELYFAKKKLVIILSGLPGVRKTSTALSAPGVLLADMDRGLCRVRQDLRKDTILSDTYEEFLADVEAAKGHYESLVIDTAGAFVELMKEWAMRTDPAATKKNGGFSLQGFGIIKSEFMRWMSDVTKHFNVIFVFHEQVSKNNESIFYDLVCEGSAKVLVYQPADLAGHMFVQNGKYMIGFTPTEEYSAKSAYGIKGLIEIPDVKPGEPNTFLTVLFDNIRANLDAEAKQRDDEENRYKAFMETELASLSMIDNVADMNAYYKYINGKDAPHVLTSKKELMNALKNKCTELGIVWDSTAKAFVVKDAN